MIHPVDRTDMILPTLTTLLFHAQGTGGKTVLVDVGPHLLEAADRPPGYELCTLAPPASIQALAASGAQFQLSRQGRIRVWLTDKLIAAEAEADCINCQVHRLDQAEFEYLNAYMVATGRRWNDPGQLDMPAPAAQPEVPAPAQARLLQGLYRLVVRSLQP